MKTRGRALYNLLRVNFEEDPKSFPITKWQIEDYRSLALEELFRRLEKLGISLDEEHFINCGENSVSPEELTDILCDAESIDKFDQAYLLIFELWRRLLSKKESLSIFCDELDRLIDFYDREDLIKEEPLQDALSDLERILDKHVDEGEDPKHVFAEVVLYCAHDLESFIYDYVLAKIDQEEMLYASELLDGFSPYLEEIHWLTFLYIRLLADTDQEEAEVMLSQLLEGLEEEPDFELLLEIARFLVNRGDTTHFINTVAQCKTLIETEQDFQELLAITCAFYRLLDRDKETAEISNILKMRQDKSLDQKLSSNEPALKKYYQLLKDFDGTKV